MFHVLHRTKQIFFSVVEACAYMATMQLRNHICGCLCDLFCAAVEKLQGAIYGVVADESAVLLCFKSFGPV